MNPERKKILQDLSVDAIDASLKRKVFSIFEFLGLKDSDKVLCCDLNQDSYLDFAQAISTSELSCLDLASWQIAQSSETKLPFADNEFDKIILPEILDSVLDPAHLLAELNRVLKPKGAVGITVTNARFPFFWDPINWLLEVLSLSPIRNGRFAGVWRNKQRLYQLEQLRAALWDAGFVTEQERRIAYFSLPFTKNIVDCLEEDSELNPLALKSIKRVFHAIDILNDVFVPRRASVAIAIRAYKPEMK